jgi:hypothetical protein
VAELSPWSTGITLSVLQALESGVPYSASNQNGSFVNGVDPRPWSRIRLPESARRRQHTVFLHGARCVPAGRAEAHRLCSDVQLRLSAGGGSKLNLFIQAQLINVFNQFQLCGCGGSAAFALGGNVQNQTVDTAVRTNVTNPTLYQAFNRSPRRRSKA